MRRFNVRTRYCALALILSFQFVNADERPLVDGGIGDKPFMTEKKGKTRIGGYSEVHFRYGRSDGVTEELGFEAKRFNLFSYTRVADRLQVVSELEFEEGGEEIKLEIAVIDFEIHPALTFRGGIVLSPLGRFNLSHDSPANDLTDRPLVSTQIIPTALSEAGMGFYGSFYPSASARLAYEIYAVNGFNEGVISDSGNGTRIAEGRGNFEDNNNWPAFVGRLAFSPQAGYEIGVPLHTGAYNAWKIEGLTVAQKQELTIWALDWEVKWRAFELVGEYAGASVDVPVETVLLQENQAGVYIQGNAHFGRGWLNALPESVFTGVLRYGVVDFDTDVDGDSERRWTWGLNFRPNAEAVFKLDYRRGKSLDPLSNEVKGAALLFSAATYS